MALAARQAAQPARQLWARLSCAAHRGFGSTPDDREGRSRVLPRSRSVNQEATTDGPEGQGLPRSPDAPADPFEKRHRDTRGLSPEEVQKQVRDAVSNSGARAGEALGGRADMLRENPTWHMNQLEPDLDSPPGEGPSAIKGWTKAVVGDGVKQTMKSGVHKVADSLKQMFDAPAGSKQGAIRPERKAEETRSGVPRDRMGSGGNDRSAQPPGSRSGSGDMDATERSSP